MVQSQELDTNPHSELFLTAANRKFDVSQITGLDFRLADAEGWLKSYETMVFETLNRLNTRRGPSERDSINLLIELLCEFWERETGKRVTAHGQVKGEQTYRAETDAGRLSLRPWRRCCLINPGSMSMLTVFNAFGPKFFCPMRALLHMGKRRGPGKPLVSCDGELCTIIRHSTDSVYDPFLAVIWLGVKVDRTNRPRRFAQQSAKTLPSRGALQIEDLSTEDLHPYKNDPRVKNKQTNSAVSLPRPELRNLQTLRPHQHNARTHSKRQLEQIARSIERFGFLNPVLIDASGTIIAGHGRVEAAKQLGLSRVPTLRIEHSQRRRETRLHPGRQQARGESGLGPRDPGA